MSILVVGSVALDTIHSPWGESRNAVGGSATYFAVAASLFAPVRLVGVVGSDFPKNEIAFMNKRKIDTAGLEIVPKGKTFRWTGRYEKDVNQRTTLDLKLNVFQTFHPRLPENYKNTPYVFLANIAPALQLEVLKQVRAPRLVVCDTMNIWIDTQRPQLEQLLRKVDIAILNDGEARQFARETDLIKAARYIRALGPRAVVIKKGEHGALMLTDTFFAVPAIPLDNVCDPTGAGDSFAGGFVGHLARTGRVTEQTLRQAVLYGGITASFTVETFGLKRLKQVTRRDVAQRFKVLHRLTAF
jgi:sugar/nucleoside kinase (ribokinase family)